MEKSLFLNNKSKKSLPTIIRIDLHQKKALIPLESHNDFLELFSIKSKPCFFVPIAKTLVFDEVENIKTLLENAFIGKTLIIQTKSLENVKTFFRILSEKHQKIENFPRKKTFKFCHRLYKALKLLTHFRPIAMVKLTNGRKTPVCKVEIEDFLRNKGESISFIQEFVKLPQKGANHSYETFYCEYSGLFTFKKKSRKFSDINLNICSKYYIPTQIREAKIATIQDRFIYNNNLNGFIFYCAFYQAIIDYDYNLQRTPLRNFKKRSNFLGKNTMDVYNSFDQALNNMMSQICKSLINFINSKSLEVGKIIVKYLYNSEEKKLYFIGIKELSIFPKSDLAKYPGLYDLKDLNIHEINNLNPQEFSFKPRSSLISIQKKSPVSIPNGHKNIYSNKLALILKKTSCSGDFCHHIFGNYEKGGIEELQLNLQDFKELANVISEDFKQNYYEISSNLITRARQLSEKLPEMFKKYKISCKNEAFQTGKALILHKNEYKLVKVCRNCYLIYTLLIKEFEIIEQNPKNSSNPYIHRDILSKKSNKPQVSEYLLPEKTINPIDSIEKKAYNNIKNISLERGFSSQSFSLQKRFFYPKEKPQNSNKALSSNNIFNKTFNLYKNTILTRKGEISLNSIYLEKPNPDQPSAMLKTRESLFGNPRRKSFLFAPETVKYNFSSNNNLNSPKALGTSFKKSFTSNFEAGFTLSSPKLNKENREKSKARLSTFVNKKLANLPTYQIHKILNRRKFFPMGGNFSLTHSLFHRTFVHLRKLPFFKISTPKLSLLDGKKGLEEPEHSKINIQGISNLLSIECPLQYQQLEVLVIDASTAIPYTILSSPKAKEVKNKEVLIICHDFFDDFLTKIAFYQNLIEDLENYYVILFNYPCQSYTLYNPETCYNNESLSECLDLLIYELVRRKVFHIRSDNLRFIGFGYGCNVILHFLNSANDAINTLKACLLFNCFLYLDEQLSDFLINSINFLEESKHEEYADYLFESFANKTLDFMNNIENIANKSSSNRNNPDKTFTNQARITLLKGCLDIYNISQNLPNIEKVIIIFANSSHNSLISYKQKSFLEDFPELKEIPAFIKEKSLRFSIQIPNSGYNVFKDNNQKVHSLIQDFLITEIPLNIDQRISFIDKLLLIIEENMKTFYQEEIDNFNANIEIAESFHSFDLEKFIEIEVDFTEVITGFITIKEKIEDLNEKIEKVSIVFQENHVEIKGKSDDLISKIINIQQKKINEFSRYLQTIKREIETPLKKELNLLKGTFNFLRITEEIRNFKTENIGNLMKSLEGLEKILENQTKNELIPEIEELLTRELKRYWNLKARILKKTRKYHKNIEGLDENNKKLQNFIENTRKDFELCNESIETSLMRILEKIEVKFLEKSMIKPKLLMNCFKIISEVFEKTEEKPEKKIDLMNLGRKTSENPLEISLLKSKIDRISRIMNDFQNEKMSNNLNLRTSKRSSLK